MLVLKFGGSSVANATNMSRVLDIVQDKARKDNVILVSSAISGCTDSLIETGRRAACGEDYAAVISALRDKHAAIVSRLFTGEERSSVRKDCDSTFGELEGLAAGIASRKAISPDEAELIQTFGEILSTRILAAKLRTELSGVLWIDSREIIVKGDDTLTYSNIKSATSDKDVRIFVAPGFVAKDKSGKVCTLGRGGSDYTAALYAAAVSASVVEIWTDVNGIMTTNPKVVPQAHTISRMSYDAAFCMAEHGAKVLYAPTVLPARGAGISINILNTFNPGHPGTTICNLPDPDVCEWVGLSSLDCGDGVKFFLTAEGPVDKEASKKRMLDSLKSAGIAATSTGDGDGFIWTEVRKAVEKQACTALHHEFFEEDALSTIDVYVAGYGAVGHAFERLVRSGIAARSGKDIHIAGISSDHGFAAKVLAEAPRRSVFVDCTNSEDIWNMYVPLLEAGINIVSSNRRSLAVPYVEYAAMKQAALRNGVFFRYSTTVGTALPILESMAGGEDVEYFEAVVSCTLNHIITGYDGANTESFASLLMHAQDAGLTELDPRTDLGGRDALRKLLILAREAGVALEEEDVKITPMLPEAYFNCPLDEFYSRLQAAEPDFIRREAELDEMDKRQRFVASLRRDPSSETGYKAEIKMQLYPVSSPFYWISGTQNIIEIKSKGSAPLVIKGAGEGAQQAAASILKDILN